MAATILKYSARRMTTEVEVELQPLYLLTKVNTIAYIAHTIFVLSQLPSHPLKVENYNLHNRITFLSIEPIKVGVSLTILFNGNITQ